jgi:hypothetical protein
LVPSGGPDPEVWLCACHMSDEDFQRFESEDPGLARESESGSIGVGRWEVGLERGEERDLMVIGKVGDELESMGKMDG